jgi:hypothetical protein
VHASPARKRLRARKRLPVYMYSEKVRVIGSIQKTRIPKVHTQFVHEPLACIFPVCTEPAKVSWEGTQLEVAWGKKPCKATAQIKNTGLAEIGRGGETSGLGIFYRRAIFACSNGDPSFGVAWLSLADDRLGRPTIGTIPTCHRSLRKNSDASALLDFRPRSTWWPVFCGGSNGR